MYVERSFLLETFATSVANVGPFCGVCVFVLFQGISGLQPSSANVAQVLFTFFVNCLDMSIVIGTVMKTLIAHSARVTFFHYCAVFLVNEQSVFRDKHFWTFGALDAVDVVHDDFGG